MIGLVTPKKGTPTRTNFTVTSDVVKVASANKNRKSITFQNQGSGSVFLGDGDVDVSGEHRGYALFGGATFTDNATSGEWWIRGSGSDVVHVIEVA